MIVWNNLMGHDVYYQTKRDFAQFLVFCARYMGRPIKQYRNSMGNLVLQFRDGYYVLVTKWTAPARGQGAPLGAPTFLFTFLFI